MQRRYRSHDRVSTRGRPGLAFAGESEGRQWTFALKMLGRCTGTGTLTVTGGGKPDQTLELSAATWHTPVLE